MNIEDEYLKAQLEKYSQYRKEFLDATEHEEILMVLLRAHMYIEKELVELTRIYFKYPGKFENYNFKSRLDLLFALGVIGKELYDPINKINSIRNKITHKLGFSFTEEQYKTLYDSLSNSILEEHKKDLNLVRVLKREINFIEKTRMLLSGIWTETKAEVLTSYLKMRELAKDFELQATDEILKFEKNK